MPRYVVERTFPEGLEIPADAQGARACLGIVERNADDGVTWIRSYVTGDRSKTFCVYDAPSPEAIRRTAGGTSCRSTGSPRSGSSIRTSTSEPQRASLA